MVDGAASEWIPIISDVPQGRVFGPLLFILYTREMFMLVEDNICLCRYDKPANRPAVAASLNRVSSTSCGWASYVVQG